jgi:hypothetical protein
MPTLKRHFSLPQQRVFFLLTLLLGALAFTGCHSYHIESTLVNNTGHSIELLEVQYPSASFGANHMEPGEVLHYRIQILGQGPLKVHYFNKSYSETQTNIDGPEIHEKQEGTLQIILLPDGKAQFLPQLKP